MTETVVPATARLDGMRHCAISVAVATAVTNTTAQ